MKKLLPLFIVFYFLQPTYSFAGTYSSTVSICKTRGVACKYEQSADYDHQQYHHRQMKRKFDNTWKKLIFDNTEIARPPKYVTHNTSRNHRYYDNNFRRECIVHEYVDCYEDRPYRPRYQSENNNRYIKKKLRRIIRKAQRNNSADPWVIRRLENLLDEIPSQEW